MEVRNPRTPRKQPLTCTGIYSRPRGTKIVTACVRQEEYCIRETYNSRGSQIPTPLTQTLTLGTDLSPPVSRVPTRPSFLAYNPREQTPGTSCAPLEGTRRPVPRVQGFTGGRLVALGRVAGRTNGGSHAERFLLSPAARR